jgi:signal transduction histidine kinase
VSWGVIMTAVMVQALVSGYSPEGLEMVAAWVVGPYSVAAYGSRRDALVGIGLGVIGYGVYASQDANIRSGRSSELWAGAFFALAALAAWLVGMFVHTRRAEAAAHARALAFEHEAHHAVAEERARMARELHDIVSHNLSVVVVQAAGARAHQGSDDVASTLAKIEQSGRDALVEMRRLLGVLRSDDEPSLAPQPGIADLPALAATVRTAGLAVTVDVAPDCDEVEPVAGLSAYRIVQEALTNTLKHAQATAVTVSVRRDGNRLSVLIVDDGRGEAATAVSGGYGLLGMHERVKVLGGELRAGALPSGGFAVHAMLPVGDAG